MTPIIDVHEHFFSGRDIPVKGYLYSRRDNAFVRFVGKYLGFFALLAWCIRRRRRRQRPDWIYRLVVSLTSLATGADYTTWADILSLGSAARITDVMIDTFRGNHTALYTPLMLDYEYWFRNTFDVPLADQIETAREIIRRHGGLIHPFIPFDPVRELAFRKHIRAPDGGYEPRSMLATVKEAIAEGGFIGVKLYNALGYKPTRNQKADKKRRRIFFRICKCRYRRITGDEIDEVLDELYRYCHTEQVPITAHCLAGGIESYKNASYHFGKPRYWRAVLDQYPDLHLNLAHFGWNLTERYNGKGYGGGRPWMNQLCAMLDRYPHLYTDVAHHDVVTPKIAKEIAADYLQIEVDYPGLLDKKLLFGIDWHVITQIKNYQNFLPCYRRLLKKEIGFSDLDLDNFLGGNALRFLGLLPLGTPNEEGWTGNRRRLEAFYRTNGIAPPAWFTATG